MTTYFPKIDSSVIERCNAIVDLSEEDCFKLTNWSVDLLEGREIEGQISEYASEKKISNSKLLLICKSISTLLWECSKFLTRDLGVLPNLLTQLTISDEALPVYQTAFLENRRRLQALRRPLDIDSQNYVDLSWRLDVELSKRTLRETIEPIFQIRLDLEGTSSDNSTLNSHHLECDIPTLKFINEELQRAVDEYKGVHSQRISKYFS